MGNLQGYEQLQMRLQAIGAPKATASFMKMLGAAANAEQKRLTRPNKKTGVTSASIGFGNVTPTGVTTFAAGAAVWLERGTKPHVIRPKVAKVLAWGGARRLTGSLRAGASATNFAARVNHPGSRPYPFMEPGAREAIRKSGLLDQIIEAWNRAA